MKARARSRPTSAAVALASLLLAACGADESATPDRLTQQEYLDRARAIQQDAGSATQLYTELVVDGLLSQAECETKARAFHEEVERIVEDVSEISPPAEVEDLHAEFLAAARESSASIGRTSDAVARGEVRCGSDINARLYGLPSTQRAVGALERMGERGYVILGE